MNIATKSDQAVNSANGAIMSANSSSATKSQSSEFGSLIATLLGLNAQNQSEKTSNTNLNNASLDGSSLDGSSLAGSLNLVTSLLASSVGGANEAQNKTVISEISDLMQAIESIETSLANGKPIDEETMQAAISATSALIAKLEAIAPTSIVAATSMPNGFNADKALNGDRATGAANQASNLEVAKNILSQNQPFQASLQALTSKEAISSLAQKSQNFAKSEQNSAIAELSQKLQQLTQKLGDIAQVNSSLKNATSSAMSINADSSINNEMAKSLVALLGAKDFGVKDSVNKTAGSIGSLKSDLSAIAYLKGQKVAPNSTNINSVNINLVNDSSSSKNVITNTNIAVANNNTASLAMTLAGANAANSSANNINSLAQTDPIFMSIVSNQSGANSNIAASFKPATAHYQGPQQNLNLPHIAFEFAKNVQNGLSRFQIRLDPPEMGRIDVKMEVDRTGAINARLTVERADTLDLLQRDARALERALAQAGLDSSKTNLEFSLKDNPFAQKDNFFGQDNGNGEVHEANLAQENEQTSSEIISQMPSTIIYHRLAAAGGLNITA